MLSSRACLTSWGKGASLALVGHPSSDGVIIKMSYGIDVLHRSFAPHLFLVGWLKLNLALLLDQLRLAMCHVCTWKCIPTAILGGVDISEVRGCHLLQQMGFQ